MLAVKVDSDLVVMFSMRLVWHAKVNTPSVAPTTVSSRADSRCSISGGSISDHPTLILHAMCTDAMESKG